MHSYDIFVFFFLTYFTLYGNKDLENGLVDTVWVGESGTKGEGSISICTLLGVRWVVGRRCSAAQGTQSGAL